MSPEEAVVQIWMWFREAGIEVLKGWAYIWVIAMVFSYLIGVCS